MLSRMLMTTLALALPAVGVAADTPTATFAVNGVRLVMPMPAGFCAPTDARAAQSRALAAVDTINQTDLMLYECGLRDGVAPDDFIAIKTPKSALPMTLDREAVLAQIAAAFTGPNGAAITSEAAGEANKAFKDKGIGLVVTSPPHYLGRDDMCAYVGGDLTGAMNGEVAVTAQQGACTTVIGGKIVTIYRTVSATRGKKVDELTRAARAVAETIRVAGST